MSDESRLLAQEQTALRRVATLVARGASPEEVFATVTEEVARLLPVEYAGLARYGSDGTVTMVAAWGGTGAVFPVGSRWTLRGNDLATIVFETGRPARTDGYADPSGPLAVATRERGARSAIATPITVEGRLWGAMAAASTLEQLPADTEARLASFTELLATAIANAESRAGLARLAEEQVALRRVATLVARGAPPDDVFAAVTEEVGQLLPVNFAYLGRYESDRTATTIADWSSTGPTYPPAGRRTLGGKNIVTIVAQTGRPARLDSYADASGAIGDAGREAGVSSSVGAPVIVEGRLWGIVAAGSTVERTLPADSEARLAQFTELLATAIANAESRSGLARLADEQAALRRLATLVARGMPPDRVFAAATAEVGRLLPVEFAHLGRYESDGTVTVVAAWSATGDRLFPVGTWQILGGRNLATIVFETGRPARIEGYADASGPLGATASERGVRAAVGTPITVDGRLWGTMIAASTHEQPLPADTESRLASFTELLATAIANAESRAALAASRARIVAASDETRRQIERDLHDGAQQQLVALMLELRAATATEPSEPGELRAQLARTERALAAALEELRETSRGIHPAILSRGGLGTALRALARRSPVPVALDLRTGRRLPEHVEVAAYYVVSEALTNAAKHARASHVQVEIQAHDAILRLAIRDDGIGGADPRQGSGLVGLRDRIEALGGTLAVSSPEGEGTSLRIEIPLGGEQSAGAPEP